MNEGVSDIISYPVSLDSDESEKMLYCLFNPGVNCYDKSGCGKCGWNPAVSKQRLKKMFPDRKVKVGG